MQFRDNLFLNRVIHTTRLRKFFVMAVNSKSLIIYAFYIALPPLCLPHKDYRLREANNAISTVNLPSNQY
jgi:hypothetical protein